MPLPEAFLQELLDRSNIEAIVSGYVRMKRRGRNLVGLCPFHGEKTPSFTLYPENGSFYCFGCGAGGDVITFIKRIENLDYMDAVRFLADRAGMTMPDRDVNDAASKMRLRILEANRDAARLFHGWLYAPEGRQALAYYHGRQLSDATLRHFGMGYAPDGYHALLDAMHQKGYSDEELEAACLTRRGSSGRPYDFFRNRAMVPIIDVRGNVVAFGGRVLDDSKPKYVNTPDTPVYRKGQNLFALNFAKSVGDRHLILCEGYMDAIAMHQAGFPNAVAALGTAFPEEQVRLITRYADEITLIFDADSAGQKATQRAIAALRSSGVHLRVVNIPDGKDPDEYLRAHGADRFRVLLKQAANDLEYRLMRIGERYDIATADGRVAYLRDASDVLAGLSSPVERDVYAGKLASELQVSKEALLAQIQAAARKKQRQERRSELPQLLRKSDEELRKVNPDAIQNIRAVSAEEALLGMLFLHPDAIASIAEKLPPSYMETAFNRRVYERMIERHRNGLLLELGFFAAEYSPEEMAYLTRMVRDASERVYTPEEGQQYVDILRREHTLNDMGDPASLSPDDIKKLLETMRQSKT